MDPTLIIAAITILGSVAGAVIALRGKNKEVVATEGSNLTAGQQGFIDRLQAANAAQEKRLSEMDTIIERLKQRIDSQDEQIRGLKDQLRRIPELEDELRQTRADLAEEREARKTGQDAGELRQAKAEQRMIDDYAGGVDLPEVPEETP